MNDALKHRKSVASTLYVCPKTNSSKLTRFTLFNLKIQSTRPKTRTCAVSTYWLKYIYIHTHNSPIFPQPHTISIFNQSRWVGPKPKSSAQIIQTKFHSQESAPLVWERGFLESSVKFPPITTALFRLRLLRLIATPLPPPDLRRGGGAASGGTWGWRRMWWIRFTWRLEAAGPDWRRVGRWWVMRRRETAAWALMLMLMLIRRKRRKEGFGISWWCVQVERNLYCGDWFIFIFFFF